MFDSIVNSGRKCELATWVVWLVSHDVDGAETYGVVMTGKAKVPSGAILAGMRRIRHVFADFRQVPIENHCPVEFDANG